MEKKENNETKIFYTDEEVQKMLNEKEAKVTRGFLNRYNAKSLLEIDRLCRVGREFFDDGINNVEITMEDLDKVRCMDDIKNKIFDYLKAFKRSKIEGFGFGKIICFVGSHGVGKTFMSKILAKQLYKFSILKNDEFKSLDGFQSSASDLEEAYKDLEGLLQIKNPEFLFNTFDGDLRMSAIEILKKCSTKYHHKVVTVICCDTKFYKQIIETTPQLNPLISQTFYFPDYSLNQLIDLSKFGLNKSGFSMTEEAEEEFRNLLEVLCNREDFAYASTLKNILNKLFSVQTSRVKDNHENRVITNEDIINLEKEQFISRAFTGEEEKVYESKLKELIGLESVKKEISRMKAYALKHKNDSAKINLNFAFVGKPGTGKTEVAKLLAGIFYENGILPLNKISIKGRSDLVGKYIGQTAPLITKAFEEAMGGVLFIDEAYSLFYQANDPHDYGYEALSELVRLMDENKGKISVVFAGYKKETLKMIDSNPGLRSRLTKVIVFNNYEPEELFDIGKLMLKKNEYNMDDELLCDLVISVYKKTNDKNYGNARTLRNALESLYQIQAERTLADSKDRAIKKEDLDIYLFENE